MADTYGCHGKDDSTSILTSIENLARNDILLQGKSTKCMSMPAFKLDEIVCTRSWSLQVQAASAICLQWQFGIPQEHQILQMSHLAINTEALMTVGQRSNLDALEC